MSKEDTIQSPDQICDHLRVTAVPTYLLAIIKHLLEVLADMLGVTYEELSASIVRSEKMLEKYIVMAEALEELEEAA